MAGRTSSGTCSLCGRSVGKSGIARHLNPCKESAGASGDRGASRGRQRQVNGFHLAVEGRYKRDYWMHLEVPADLKLQGLDHFLRDTWLECCGHLSAFTIQEQVYLSTRMEPGDRGMGVALGRVLRPGMKFFYEYDFGSTTELALSVVSEGGMAGRDIRSLARNNAPVRSCFQCGSPATGICAECDWDAQGLLCEECTGKHGCDEEMLLPVVNSPRAGTCAYTG